MDNNFLEKENNFSEYNDVESKNRQEIFEFFFSYNFNWFVAILCFAPFYTIISILMLFYMIRSFKKIFQNYSNDDI